MIYLMFSAEFITLYSMCSVAVIGLGIIWE